MGFLANGETISTPKRVNDEASAIGTCKFEFSTIKNHYKDIHNDILDKSSKKPQKWGVFSPKSPRGTRTRVFPGWAVLIIRSEQLSPHFVNVSEKSNGRIKSYKAKSVVLDDLGLLGGHF